MPSTKVIVALVLGSLFTFPARIFAAPNVTVTTDSKRQYVNLSFSDLASVARVSYILVYDTTRGQRGLEGGIKNKGKVRRSNRRQILGTCSSGKCVYHQGVKNISIEATFYLKNGGRSTVSRLIP